MKTLVTLQKDFVAPRFDRVLEVLLVESRNGNMAEEPRLILLPEASADELCALILKEGVSLVICGGIEESHFQYLAWKKITVIDRVIGSWKETIRLSMTNSLKPGDVVS